MRSFCSPELFTSFALISQAICVSLPTTPVVHAFTVCHTTGKHHREFAGCYLEAGMQHTLRTSVFALGEEQLVWKQTQGHIPRPSWPKQHCRHPALPEPQPLPGLFLFLLFPGIFLGLGVSVVMQHWEVQVDSGSRLRKATPTQMHHIFIWNPRAASVLKEQAQGEMTQSWEAISIHWAGITNLKENTLGFVIVWFKGIFVICFVFFPPYKYLFPPS